MRYEASLAEAVRGRGPDEGGEEALQTLQQRTA